MMLIWVDDDTSRDTYIRYRLVYSLYINGSWSVPKAVDDDGMIDYQVSATAVCNVCADFVSTSIALTESEPKSIPITYCPRISQPFPMYSESAI